MSNRKIITSIALLTLTAALPALAASTDPKVEWEAYDAGPYNQAMVVDAQDNVIVLSQNYATTVAEIVKREPVGGAVQWSTALSFELQTVGTDPLGDVYSGGQTPAGAAAVVALDGITGQTLWTYQSALTGYYNALAVSSNGFLAAVGYGGTGFLVTKLDTAGTLLWEQTLFSGNWGEAVQLAIDAAGDVVVVGRDYSANGDLFTVVKLNGSDGTIQWTRSRLGEAWAVGVDSQNRIVAVGYSGGWGASDFAVEKYASDGTVLWSRDFDFGPSDAGWDLAFDDLDDIFVVGEGDDVLVTQRLSGADGSVMWQDQVAGTGNTFGMWVVVDSMDHPVVMGMFDGELTARKYTTKRGELVWSWVVPGVTTGGAWQRTLGVTADDGAIVYGTVYTPGVGYTATYTSRLNDKKKPQ